MSGRSVRRGGSPLYSTGDMTGRSVTRSGKDKTLADMMGRENTPQILKTNDAAPALSSLEHDMPFTPRKRGHKKKRLLDQNHNLEGTQVKKVCIVLEKTCVRRPLIDQLYNLKAEPENLTRCREDSDQESSSDHRKAQNKTTGDPPSKQDILNMSSNNSSVVAQMSCGNKRLVVKLTRLQETSENLEQKTLEEIDNNEKDIVEDGSINPTVCSASALIVQSSSNILRKSLRTKNVQEDVSEKETKLSLQTDCAADLLANLNVTPKVKEEKQFTDESDSDAESDQEQMELSAYERERLRNIKENAKFLKSIKLLESAASLHPIKKKNPVVKREKTPNTQNTVVRRSMRLQNAAPSEVKLEEQTSTVEENVQVMKPPGPLEMIAVNQQNDPKAMDHFLTMWTSISQETVKTPMNVHAKALKSYENSLKNMTLTTEDVAKVVPGRILSVTIHPSESQTLVAAGDKYGNVGLWNLDDHSDDKGAYMFELHSRHVGSLSFCPWNSAHLLSLSYDGTVRCGDVTRSVFDEIYRDEEENFSSFDFLSDDGSVLIVSHWDSKLSLVDRRTPGATYEAQARLDLSGPRSVGVHPLQRKLCVVAGARDVCVYDVRQLSNKKLHPVISLPGHTKIVQSAYFSPVTGNRILTTCADDRLRVFDSSSLSSKIPLLTSIRHNNFTGRWLSRFRAVWDPKQEDCFVIGSMDRPRQIQVFSEDGNLVHIFWDSENLNSVCSINAMHPTKSIVVGGNSSGRLHVFRNKSS